MVKHAGEAHSLKVEKILFQGKSDYQNVIVFQVNLLHDERDGTFFLCNYWSIMINSLNSTAVINLRKGSCLGWCDSTHREG